jgi:rare lipoprotein A
MRLTSKWKSIFFAAGLALALGACSCLPKGVADLDVGVKERGIASWYGDDFHGWVTASGDLYDMHALTGAHRTLPLGTVVRVTNVVNGRHVMVRINDRGPYVNGRILDLSLASARRLGMVEDGVAAVHLEVVGQAAGMPLTAEPRSFLEGTALTITPDAGQEWTSARIWEQLNPDALQNHRALRLPPGDMLRERRARRVADILAADRRTYDVATLELS